MAWIYLNEMTFKVAVGVTEEERTKQNKVVIDLGVKVKISKAGQTDSVEDTVDYEQLYLTVKDCLSTPCSLLETLVNRIDQAIKQQFKTVKGIHLKVSKMNPPISGPCKSSTIHFKRKY